ncbi:MAG TPA: hypothetical protein VG737_16570, partial [Cyclobacteriaceae bacterium]|nr:hypothetical protein [Cyclobacteriaceae bacterium]
MFKKISSIQKYGLGIMILCVLWLITVRDRINLTLEELDTIEGKIIDIYFERTGKYNIDTVLYCTLDDGHEFY